MEYSSRVYSARLHEDFEHDLEELSNKDQDAAAYVIAFIEESKLNQRLLDDLTRHGRTSYGEHPFNVSDWSAMQRTGLNLWRLKFIDFDVSDTLRTVRLIYAFHHKEFRYYFLAIAPREFNYEPEHTLSKRIAAAYRTLDIPTL